MLHEKAVEAGTLDLIKRLMAEDLFSEFSLVGGTALALLIGHRKSIDIDLFTRHDFNAAAIANYLISHYQAKNVQSIKNGVFCFIQDIKVDIISHQYPLVDDLQLLEGIRIISLKDIAAMKLNAIFNNGTRLKDFADVTVLLEFISLDEMIQSFEVKYADIDSSMVRKALVYFKDVQVLEPIDYLGHPIEWRDIEARLTDAYFHPNKIFEVRSK